MAKLQIVGKVECMSDGDISEALEEVHLIEVSITSRLIQ